MSARALSPHLSEAEFLATQHRDLLGEQEASWRSNPALRMNGARFAADVFEPVRAILGALHVTSGYRCPRLNSAVGGQPASHHLLGLAADVVPVKGDLVSAMCAVREAMREGKIPALDEAIFEHGRWIHIQAALSSARPRGVALMTFGGGSYPLFDAADPRVAARRLA